MRILLAISLLILGPFRASAADWNAAVLAAIREFPAGGGYAVTSEAGARLRAAVKAEGGRLQVRPATARPGYCSGATYLALLVVVERAQNAGRLNLDASTLAQLAPGKQRDGQGVWGRWNANGPGTARLFHELGLGRNFVDWTEARPGDFLKIFWRDAVGAHERGHSVVYLGAVQRGDEEFVRYWSSNKPDGFGEKTVARSKIARAIFSRLESPERLAAAGNLPPTDAYLASLLHAESSFAEACAKAGVR